MSSLLFFLTPAQIVASFQKVEPEDLGLSLAFFFLGCWVMTERWRACLGFRASRVQSFHSMGVANGGNLLIPGRIGEPLRIYLLAQWGVPAEFGTSGVVQERMADQVLRVLFIALAIFMSGMSGGGDLQSRLVAVTVATVSAGLFFYFMIRSRESVSKSLGRTLGRLPRLREETVANFILRTLTDLRDSWYRPGGKKALFWGLISWLCFLVHTEAILDSFFTSDTLALALLMMAVMPTTAPTQPGLYHGLALAGLVMMGEDKVPALQACVVLHMCQMVFFSLWGIVGWLWANRLIARSAAARSGQDIHEQEAAHETT